MVRTALLATTILIVAAPAAWSANKAGETSVVGSRTGWTMTDMLSRKADGTFTDATSADHLTLRLTGGSSTVQYVERGSELMAWQNGDRLRIAVASPIRWQWCDMTLIVRPDDEEDDTEITEFRRVRSTAARGFRAVRAWTVRGYASGGAITLTATCQFSNGDQRRADIAGVIPGVVAY